MIEAIQIGNLAVNMKATGNTPKKYREAFKKDLLVEIQRFMYHVKRFKDDEGNERAELTGDFDFGVIERLGYIMALQADNTIGSMDDWLDQFGPSDLYRAMPDILNLWHGSREPITQQKKSTEN